MYARYRLGFTHFTSTAGYALNRRHPLRMLREFRAWYGSLRRHRRSMR